MMVVKNEQQPQPDMQDGLPYCAAEKCSLFKSRGTLQEEANTCELGLILSEFCVPAIQRIGIMLGEGIERITKVLDDVSKELEDCIKSLNKTIYGDENMTARENAKDIQDRLRQINEKLKEIIGSEKIEATKKLKFKPGDKVRIKTKINSGGYEYNEHKGEVLGYRESLGEYHYWIKVKGKPPIRVYEKELEVI